MTKCSPVYCPLEILFLLCLNIITFAAQLLSVNNRPGFARTKHG